MILKRINVIIIFSFAADLLVRIVKNRIDIALTAVVIASLLLERSEQQHRHQQSLPNYNKLHFIIISYRGGTAYIRGKTKDNLIMIIGLLLVHNDAQ